MTGRLSALVAGVFLIVVSAGSATAAGSDPFRGTWSAVDIDGSRMTLAFSGSGVTRAVSITDYRATFCGGEPYDAAGTGTIDGSVIHVVGLAGCRSTGLIDPSEATYTYNPDNGSLFDGAVAWYRGSPQEAFLGVWKGTDIDGSAMTLSFGGTGLTRSVAFFDALATGVCEPDAPFSGAGVGTIGSVPGDGRFIRVVASGSCEGSSELVNGDDKYEYDHETDTLVGPLEPLEIGGVPRPWTVVWHR
jgi:hypothetical protein